MTRKTLLVLAVVCLALTTVAGFAGSATAAHVPADGGGAADQGCGAGPEPLCGPGGGGGGDDGGGGGGCGAGPEPFCA